MEKSSPLKIGATVICVAVVFFAFGFYIGKEQKVEKETVSMNKEMILGFNQDTDKIEIFDESTNTQIPILILPPDSTLGLGQTKSPDGSKIFFTILTNIIFYTPEQGKIDRGYPFMTAYAYEKGKEPQPLFTSDNTEQRGPYFYLTDISPDGNVAAYELHTCSECDAGSSGILIYDIQTRRRKIIDYGHDFKFTSPASYSYKEAIPVTDGIGTMPGPLREESIAFLDSYQITKPNLYIYGYGLASVKILGIPTGTGMTESKIIGSATLQPGNKGNQTWIFQPKEEQLLLTSMSIEAYDKNGVLVKTIKLPYSGGSSVYEAFY